MIRRRRRGATSRSRSARSPIRGSAACSFRFCTIRLRTLPTRRWRASRRRRKDDFVFVPSLVSLLRNRRLKGRARAALVAYGEPVVDSLAFFLRDPEEDIWVRRHIPGTLGADPVAEDRRRPRRRARRNATGSSATRSCRRSSACVASIPSSPSRASRSRRSPFRKRAATSISCRSTTTCSASRSSPPTRCSRRGSPNRWRGFATGS